ncbi:hypothetical protein F0562_021458 [Nyssa sinensis]|uniref:Uncharacterized protein n=1 Tax=Nyssa sinensis TaxID=561372 RepID=A0A5J5BMP9_9ASTE|nr:hypothetical protein F0562_021458 [Nyssa sinensis]
MEISPIDAYAGIDLRGRGQPQATTNIIFIYILMDNRSAIVAAIVPAIAKDDKKPPPPLDGEMKKKKRGPFSLLKAALFMTRHRSNGKSKSLQVEVASKGMLNKIVGSMRPLHLQDDDSPPPLLIANSPSPTVEPYEDLLSPPMSPASSSSSSADSMSRYASATNLQELEKGGESRYASAADLRELDNEEGESDDEIDDNMAGDDMINVKAEEFIAHFYRQMRIQSQESMDR